MAEATAFHGDPNLRIDFLRQLQIHYNHGQIVQGTNGSALGGWHGCNVTCALRCFDRIHGHVARSSGADVHELANLLGVPVVFVEIDSWVFENLRDDEYAARWPLLVYNHVLAGVNLTGMLPIFHEELVRAVPKGLKNLLLQHLHDPDFVHDGAWDTWRHVDGIGMAGAFAVGDAFLAALDQHTLRHPPPAPRAEQPSRYAKLADEMLRNIVRGGMP